MQREFFFTNFIITITALEHLKMIKRYKKETLKVEPCLGTIVLNMAIMIIRTEK